MAVGSVTDVRPSPSPGDGGRTALPAATPRFEWAVLGVSLWFLIGGYADAWAHLHGRVESFFTPYHAIIYSAMVASLVLFAATLRRNLGAGYPLRRSMPLGYGLSAVGSVLFLVAGAADMTWHIVFGIEVSIQALLSPTHLALGLSGALLGTGPLRAAWLRGDVRAPYPAVFSGILLLASFVFFTQYAHPYFDVWAAKGWVTSPFEAGVAMGVMGIMLETAFLVGIMLTLLRRFELPAGTMLLFFLLGGIPVAAIQENWVFVQTACVAGIAAEVAHRYLRPSAQRVREFRIFAFGVPAFWIAAYIATVAIRWGLGWQIHVWAGSIVLAGIVGLLLSYAIVQPAPVAALSER
jgi:hypothetical protein